jgi:hypothetical protein
MNATPSRTARHSWIKTAEPDCIHWTPEALDLEPEQCWCLCCGEALPCSRCLPEATESTPTKELIPHVS